MKAKYQNSYHEKSCARCQVDRLALVALVVVLLSSRRLRSQYQRAGIFASKH